MKVVVTGASGFLGSALARRLRATGVDVCALARCESPNTELVSNYRQAPVADVLVHLAESNDRRQVQEAGAPYEQEAASTMKALLAKGYGRVIYASSAVLYGDTSPVPCRTDAALHITDVYTRIKRCNELAALDRGGVAARLVNLFGPGMAHTNVLSTILAQIPGSGPLQVKDASPVRDFLWVDDAARALVSIALGTAQGVFNVGTGQGTSIEALARCGLDLVGESDRSVISTASSGRVSRLVVDIDDTRKAFGWQPVTALREGLAELLRSNPERSGKSRGTIEGRRVHAG